MFATQFYVAVLNISRGAGGGPPKTKRPINVALFPRQHACLCIVRETAFFLFLTEEIDVVEATSNFRTTYLMFAKQSSSGVECISRSGWGAV